MSAIGRARMQATRPLLVMPGLVPGIHAFAGIDKEKPWMAGTSPAMTAER